jgi:probable DNA metabolism protein
VQPHIAALTSETDLAGFRHHARHLLATAVPPEQTEWSTPASRAADLFDASPAAADDPETNATGAADDAAIRLPAAFVALCGQVILHSDPARFDLLYRLAWRLNADRDLWHDTLDADRMRAEHLAQAVRREMHKMTAFVRFRPIDDGGDAPLHVAWFEPAHHIVEATAPFFARRFANMRWALLTPDRCARWDGQQLQFGPGVAKDQAPDADAGEALWLTYYRSIFNPARLKLKMMEKEMPRRYWKNLPEAQLISGLVAGAAERRAEMIAAPPSVPARRIPINAAGPAASGADASSGERGGPSPQTARPASMTALARDLDACRACPIGQFATQGVPGAGPAHARLMLVGEQPGDQEDLRGAPFVGPAGQLLDRALAAVGLPRGDLYLTNAVKHFKFELRGKRRIHKTPAQREADVCSGWLEHEIALLRPAAIVALGATAARSLLGRPVAVMRERGTWQQRADGLPVLVTLHPSALLRMPPDEQHAAFERWLADLRPAVTRSGIPS